MKGFIFSLTMILGVLLILGAGYLLISVFAGGERTSAVFGWTGGSAELLGIQSFITTVYNSLVVISSWLYIIILFSVFIGIQGIFVYAYFRIGSLFLSFRKDFEKILNELLDI